VDPRLGRNARLDAIAAVIDWAPLERLAETVRSSGVGRPPYCAGAMIRALYLQMLYGLLDPELEEALLDRLSFRRFRRDAAATGVLAACFEEAVRQLDAQGLVTRRGTLVDATIIQAASRKPGMKAGKGCGLDREPGARWTVKNGRSYFGYRLHVGTDQEHNIIRTVAFTPADVGESPVAESLVSGDEAAVYGDKGYENKQRRGRLKARGCKDRICHRSHKNQDGLPFWQTRRNTGIAKRRAQVEQVFGTAKRVFGYTRARSVNFMTNLGQAFCCATVFNLRRAAGLQTA